VLLLYVPGATNSNSTHAMLMNILPMLDLLTIASNAWPQV
jgi:hypothetical protein